MKVLLLLALATLGQCALFGRDKCSYGPSYWCSHIDHAKKCGAIGHCMTTVWKNQRTEMIGSTETCFDVIKVLDVVRQSSDHDFRDQWALGCTGMPPAKRHQCMDMIRTYPDEVAMLMSNSDLTTRQVASILKLCGGFADTVPRQVEVTGGDYCQDCKNFFGDLREIFNNSEGQAENLVKNLVCTKAGPLESLCDQLVDQYLGTAFDMIYQQIDPQAICSALKLCASQARAALVKDLKHLLAQRQRSAAECDLCKSIAKDVQEALQDQTLQKDVISALEDEVCPELGSFAAQCKAYVAQYGPVVFQVLIAELDPQTVCQTVGLCNGTRLDRGRLVHVPLASAVGAVQIKAPATKVSSLECSACKYLVGKVEEDIKSGTSVEKAVENLCKKLPEEWSEECTELVEKYGEKLITILVDEVDPEKVCQLLGVCSSAKMLQEGKSALAAVRKSTRCTVCLEVMAYVQKELNSSEAEAVEKELLDKICDVVPIPAADKSVCKMFINEYLPSIFNFIEEEDDPKKICSILRLCGKSTTPDKNHALKFLPMTELRPAAKRPLLGSEKCTYGPSFWCASDENARLCNAVEHCNKMKNKLN